ncbi:MAG: BspA family leucine-rich repeat surface protein [Flavobacteriaceae bacterium]|nr:BspA family leucine-rich repeat surface protein [Flavobacteriaceae bacterium]
MLKGRVLFERFEKEFGVEKNQEYTFCSKEPKPTPPRVVSKPFKSIYTKKELEQYIYQFHTLLWKVRNNEDVSKVVTTFVTNMNRLFYKQQHFLQDISSWDTSNVWNMFQMFREAKNFNLDIGSWDVGNVETMYGMFEWTRSFNQDISRWDVSQVDNIWDVLLCYKV